jgi:membrane protease YdiL (CAAX protease family)
MSHTNIFTRKPLVSFFLLAFIISWVIWTPLVVYYYRSPFPISFAETPPLLIALALLGFFGPTFAGLIMAGLEDGRAGIKRLLSGWKRWRVGIQWYLVILVSQLVIELAGIRLYMSSFAVNPDVNWSAWYMFLPTFLRVALIGGALAEETGWRGYALPRLLRSKNALTSSVIIGVIWAAWHLPISLIPGANFPVPLTPLVFLVFTLNATFISIIMTWLYNNTRGSIFICYFYHALLNVALLGAVFHFEDFASAWWVKVCCAAALRGVFALLLVLIFGAARLSRRQDAIAPPHLAG